MESLKKHKKKTHKQVRFLMSKGSPLTPDQKLKLAMELESGRVHITDKKKHGT